MLQRIQTLYLFIGVVISVVANFFAVGGLFNNEPRAFVLDFLGLWELIGRKEFLVRVEMFTLMATLIPLLSFISIFLFRKRMLQVRILVVNAVLMLGYYGVLFIYLWQFGKVLNADMHLEFPASFQLVNLILTILAILAILKDEALVRSLNRLR
jgi:hypothetical protein